MKHKPERTCIACRNKGEQSSLLRIGSRKDGRLNINGERYGRGVYLCRSEQCILKALEKNKLFRALRQAYDEVGKNQIKQELLNLLREAHFCKQK